AQLRPRRNRRSRTSTAAADAAARGRRVRGRSGGRRCARCHGRRCGGLLRQRQARGVLLLPQRRDALGDRPLPHRVLIVTSRRRQTMCGIVGLHLRPQELYPRCGELLTGMLCEMGDRGSDSAGVAVYGDPIWSPPGRACVSVLEVDPIADDLGLDVNVTRHGDTHLVTADASSETLLDAVKAAYPQALIAGFGADMAVLK